jgi:hypothetical protein
MARENLPTGPPSAWAILSGPLLELPLIDRMLVRSVALVSRCKKDWTEVMHKRLA